MDETTFRILDALSRDFSQTSINELTSRIEELYGTAYYKNIYDKIHDLRKHGILAMHKVGKSSVIELNFNNYFMADILAEMELKRKAVFLEKKPELQALFMEMEAFFTKGFYFIGSILLINPEKNAKLNRLELLFLLKKSTENEIQKINSFIRELQNMYNIKIDCLILEENEFLELLSSDNNPLKEMLSNKIALYLPQLFWSEIRAALAKGIKIKFEKEETNPAKISEQDLIYNLSRFGYKEMSHKINQGRYVCIELVITSILLKNDARRIEAIPILLAINKVNYNLLLFLCQKYSHLEKIFGLLTILNRIKEDKKTENIIKILKNMKLKEIKFDEKSIRQKMRLYNAI